MAKSIEEKCVEFVRGVSSGEYGTYVSSYQAARKLFIQMCSHGKVEENQYCHLCGWHNVTFKNVGEFRSAMQGVCRYRGCEVYTPNKFCDFHES